MTYEQRQAAEAVLNERDREAMRRSGVRLPAALQDMGMSLGCHSLGMEEGFWSWNVVINFTERFFYCFCYGCFCADEDVPAPRRQRVRGPDDIPDDGEPVTYRF
jgi:hypothetical protein